jgi:DNA-binding transcriptional LysR family regulator
VRGHLRVTLAPTLATHLNMLDFADFARLHPEVEMEILPSYEPASLTNREADIAIRVIYDRKTLPLNLHGLKGPELFEGVLHVPRSTCRRVSLCEKPERSCMCKSVPGTLTSRRSASPTTVACGRT